MHIVSSTRRLTAMALLAAVGVALFVIESYVPMPLPFLKVGLANISSVIALLMLGPSAMVTVVVLRVVVGSLMVGSFMSPTFLLALAAGTSSAIAMAATKWGTGNLFSALGLSLIGSFTHVGVQILIVRFVYVQSAGVLHLLPLLFVTALVGGVVVGGISLRLFKALKEIRV